jgi:hypothetical protein
MEHYRGWHGDDARDWCDVTDEIELEVLVERRINSVRNVGQKDRIAVGGCIYDCFGSNVVASARPVLNDELLTKSLREPIALLDARRCQFRRQRQTQQSNAPVATDNQAPTRRAT